jgi:hypothetical protein
LAISQTHALHGVELLICRDSRCAAHFPTRDGASQDNKQNRDATAVRVFFLSNRFFHLAVAMLCNLDKLQGQLKTDEQEALFSLLLGID